MPSLFYILSRGKITDYSFLLHPPEELWWRSYQRHTSFEDPTLIIEGDGNGGRFYMSGIPSYRRDRVDTIIRYTIVAEFKQSEERLIHLSQLFLDELNQFNKQGSMPTLSSIFDKHFPEDFVEETLIAKSNLGDPEYRQLMGRVNDLLVDVQEENSKADRDLEQDNHLSYSRGIWWGGVENATNHPKWMSLAEKILKEGYVGKALLLNLVTERSIPKFASEIQSSISDLSLLVTDTDQQLKLLKKKPPLPMPLPMPLPLSPKKWWLPFMITGLIIPLLIVKMTIFDGSPSIKSFEFLSSLDDRGNSEVEELIVEASIYSREEIQSIQLSAQPSDAIDTNQDLINLPSSLDKCERPDKNNFKCLFPVSIPEEVKSGTYNFKLTVQDKDGKFDKAYQERAL